MSSFNIKLINNRSSIADEGSVALNSFDQITDLSVPSFSLLISSALSPWAHEDNKRKVKGDLQVFFRNKQINLRYDQAYLKEVNFNTT